MPNGGDWTPARFRSFIMSALRSASNKWPPKYKTRKAAWLERGVYKCVGYKRKAHKVRAKDAQVDHINPVVDPAVGFQSWDEVIERMFCEADGLQLMCRECHKAKTADERAERKKNNGR